MAVLDLATGKQRLADLIARSALRVPTLEKMIARGCHSPRWKELGLAAVAHGYSRVLKHRELRIADLGGYRLWVNVAEHLGIGPYFFGDRGAVWLTSALVRHGDVCVDAGANAGHYTFWMASIVGKQGCVFAFDANPDMVDLLRRSTALNGYEGFVEVVQRALWSVPGEEMTFFLSVESSNSGTSSLVDHGWFLSRDKTIRVTTTTLDEFAKERALRSIRLVKLDVERAEEHVLRGASALLSSASIDYLIVELESGKDAEAILLRHGYVGYLLDVPGKRLRPLTSVSPGTFCDALFVSPTESRHFHATLGGSIDG